jgi:glutamyl-Q tRNA(Asp) synthetase
MVQPVFRLAPSPNGYLHLGHAFSALLNHDMAQALGGRLFLRIENIDAARCRPQFEAAIFEDLGWLGVTWEGDVRRQSEHFETYRAALERLETRGLIYPSFESRAEIAGMVAERERTAPWPRDPDGAPLYPGDAKRLSGAERARKKASDAPFALRLDMERALALAGRLEWTETGRGPAGETGTIAAVPQIWGDVVLARKETPTSYHLAVAVDDAQQGVTHVVRGEDLFWSTSVHRLLQTLLGFSAPTYHHHHLIRDSTGKKLSKSTQATGLRELRAQGIEPDQIRKMVGLAST